MFTWELNFPCLVMVWWKRSLSMSICGDEYKSFWVLKSIFFLYCMLNSSVKTCLRATVVFDFETGHSMRGPLWSVSAGGTYTVKWIPELGKTLLSVMESFWNKSAQVCHPLGKLFLPDLSQRWLNWGTCCDMLLCACGCVVGRSLVPCASRMLVLPRGEGGGGLFAVEVLVALMDLYAV